LPTTTAPSLTPRKSPLQARSATTVEAILEAALQLLIRTGPESLTTTQIAARAGVSVGTLYQYFPNKASLYQALLREKLERVTLAIETVCAEQRGKPLDEMASALIEKFLEAKLKTPEASAALYLISDSLDAAALLRTLGNRSRNAIAGMLATAPVKFNASTELIATTLHASIAGASRNMLESRITKAQIPAMAEQLTTLARAYLQASVAQQS